MSLKDFIPSKLFLKHLGIAMTIAISFIIIILLWLNIYTRHGQARPVPSFIGFSTDEAEELAKKARLKYQVIDSIYTSLVPRGCVAEQNPKPGFKVKKWRNIALTINAFRPEMVAMPNLVDLPLRQAIALIESSGLVMGTLRYKPDLSIDVVLNQLHNGKEISESIYIRWAPDKFSIIFILDRKSSNNEPWARKIYETSRRFSAPFL